METKHTEGKVHFGKTDDDKIMILNKSGIYICTIQIKQQGGGAIAAVMEDVRRANAEHLKLCWNSHDSRDALLEACKGARKLYDEMARGPLGNAAKFGPDFEPMSDEDILEIRKALEDAIATTEGK